MAPALRTALLLLLATLLAPISGGDVEQIFVRKNTTLVLHAPPTNHSTAPTWSRARLWNPRHVDVIASDGNCSMHPYFQHHLVSCGPILGLRRADYRDAGLYFVQTPEGNSTFNVTVFDSTPVLSVAGVNRVHVSIQCWDLSNPAAEMSLETRPFPGHEYYIPRVTKTREDSWMLTIEGLESDRYVIENNRWYLEAEARCCATFHHSPNCGPWTRFSHNMYLAQTSAWGRPWCSEREGHLLNGIDFAYFHEGPLHEPTCYQNQFMTWDRHVTPCEGVNSTIHYWKEENVVFKKRDPVGGKHIVATGFKYHLVPRLNDTGLYFIKEHNQTQLNFSMHVLPKLHAAVSPVFFKNNEIRLRCAHNGRPHAKIDWYVGGTYGSYHIKHNELTFHADCWKDWDHWYYKFGLRCKVTDGPFTVNSRWFIGEALRSDFFICKDRRGRHGIGDQCTD